MADRISRRSVLIGGLAVAGVAGTAGPLFARAAAAAPDEPGILVEPEELPWPEARRIVQETTVPQFPDRIVNVMDHGARGDGGGDNTAAFRRAIAACTDAGGGVVLVPAGTYVTGAIHLRNNVNLRLDGATLRFSGTAANFPVVRTRYEGIECMNRSPMIYAFRQRNIAITGRGTLDAAATSSWNKGSERAWLETQLSKPVEERVVPGSGHNMRSTFIEPYDCDNVLIQGITLRNSMFWQIHPTLCRNVTVDSVTTDASTAHSNTDACDPESCDHVVVRNCNLGAHDDNIAIKSGRDADGRRVNVPCQNLVVFGCRMNGNWGAITCGSEQTGGIRNVYAYKCTLVGVTKFALYVKSNTRRGGFSENINLDSFTGVLDRSVAFVTSTYNDQTGSFVPRFGPITITNTSVTRTGRAALDVSGLSNSHIRGLTLRNCHFTGVANTTNTLRFVDDLVLTDVTINGRQIGTDPPAGRRFQAENATLVQAVVESTHPGFNGSGYANYNNVAGGYIEWTVDAATAGSATLGIRYANGTTANRPMDITVNGSTVASGLSFPGTGGWPTWQTRTFTATLVAGTNTVRATAPGAEGGPNVDYLEVT